MKKKYLKKAQSFFEKFNMIFGWEDVADLALELAIVDIEFEKNGNNTYKKILKDFFDNADLKKNDMKLFSWKPDLINKLMIDSQSKEYLFSCVESDWDEIIISKLLSHETKYVSQKIDDIFSEIVNSRIRWFKTKS
tara:strand:- start:1284 stop:1691 length:408 start_codon:yes stop_codon:yes gene_type:complete